MLDTAEGVVNQTTRGSSLDHALAMTTPVDFGEVDLPCVAGHASVQGTMLDTAEGVVNRITSGFFLNPRAGHDHSGRLRRSRPTFVAGHASVQGTMLDTAEGVVNRITSGSSPRPHAGSDHSGRLRRSRPTFRSWTRQCSGNHAGRYRRRCESNNQRFFLKPRAAMTTPVDFGEVDLQWHKARRVRRALWSALGFSDELSDQLLV